MALYLFTLAEHGFRAYSMWNSITVSRQGRRHGRGRGRSCGFPLVYIDRPIFRRLLEVMPDLTTSQWFGKNLSRRRTCYRYELAYLATLDTPISSSRSRTLPTFVRLEVTLILTRADFWILHATDFSRRCRDVGGAGVGDEARWHGGPGGRVSRAALRRQRSRSKSCVTEGGLASRRLHHRPTVRINQSAFAICTV